MSDYIYMLESHLSPDQNRVVEDVQAAAGQAERQPVPDRRRHARHAGRIPHSRSGFRGGRQRAQGGQSHLRAEPAPRMVSTDENRKSAELVFPGGVTAQIAMSRQEKYARAGAKPQIIAGHHSGGPARPRFHLQRDRAFAQQRLTRPAARPHERPGRYRAQGTARRQHLRLLRRSLAPAAPGPLPRAAGLHGGRAHADAGGQRARSRSRKADSGARPGRRAEAHQRRRQSDGDPRRPGRGGSAAAVLAGAADQTERARAGKVREDHSGAAGRCPLARRPLRNLPVLP